MKPAERKSYEENPVRYVLGEDNFWHWFSACPEFPGAFREAAFKYDGLVPDGELCKHCLFIEFSKNLQSLLRYK